MDISKGMHFKMKKSVWQAGWIFLFVACLNTFCFAQADTVFQARIGMRDQATYHFVEVLQQRDRWIVPDVYYVDFGSNRYREVGAGGGADLYNAHRFRFSVEGFLDQALGPSSHAAFYALDWALVAYSFTPRLHADAVYFTYFPLNNAGKMQHVLERSKLEYSFQHFKIGPGYGGSQFGPRDWQHKPFLTTTLRGGGLGDLEFWFQRVAGNHMQVEIRYKIHIKKE